MKKKRILYIHHGKGLGGAPLSLLYLIEGLDKNRYHPMVLFLYDSEVVELYRSKGIEVFGPLNLSDFSHTKIWWYRWYHPHHLFRAMLATIKTIRSIAGQWYYRLAPDIVHLNTSSLLAWACVAHKRGIPVVWHIREPLASGYIGIRRLFIAWCVRTWASVIIPISRNEALPWKDDPRVRVVYNAVDQHRFNPAVSDTPLQKKFALRYHLGSGQPTILFLGGLSKEKGTHVIFEAFRKVRSLVPEARLLVAGYFDHRCRRLWNPRFYFPSQRYARNVFKSLVPIEQQVVFLGVIHDVPQAMAASDVVVFPATVGHFARPIIEAGCMGKPVVASCLPPLDELVQNHKTGFLVDIRCTDLWARKMYQLLVDTRLNRQMGRAGYQHCVSTFSMSGHVNAIESCYEKMILRFS